MDDVRDAVDSMIKVTLGVMERMGGDPVMDDRRPVLLDLVNMFDERVQALEGGREGNAEEFDGEARAASLRRWIAARDRAAERYEEETGQAWGRPGG